MNISNNKKKFYKDLLYKALIFIGTVGIIVYFLPREGKFNYQFDINKPWKYGLLQASFDFPIFKDENVVKKEQDSILSLYQPYYQLDNNIGKLEINKLRENYNKDLRKTLPSVEYMKYIEKALKKIYETGIVSNEEMNRLSKDSIRSIMVVNKNMATPLAVNNLFTIKGAYEYIMNADTIHFNRNMLHLYNLNEYITPNLTFNEQKSAVAKKDLLANISWAKGIVQSGQKIIDRGEIITPETYSILESLRKESIKRSESIEQKRMILGGQILFVSILMLCFMLYLELFRSDYYQRKGSLLLLFAIIVFYSVLTALMVSNNLFNVYIIPFAMLPMIIRIFLDSRTAFMTLITTVLISSVALRYPYEFILLQTVAGLVAIFSLRELSQRSQLFKSTILIILSYIALYFAYELIHENDLTKLNLSMYTYFIINGILLLFTYPLLFLLEKTFGFTSNVTLVELSNINNSLLRKMSEIAPGTFQHSMQVANLAAEAANKIGAKSQLVRTGALYHDIGKMVNPAFFTENQSGVNPHKSLSYEQSAQVVINHVTDGLKLAEKYNLPKVIKDFISTHHGLGQTKYFYISYKNEHPDEPIDEQKFTYPGPNPFTQETAILMMADAVEAASRSLSEYTEESISNLVEKIIDSQVAEGYFKNCPITFKDIETVKSVFKEKLKIVYHTRISYPELKTK
ncbi:MULTISPECIES: HD family phosphohydrolase [unclassified Bacteroides]|jgi:putative nucleotidyltransferase with HDIG domain|uniref:HD family phosphohydrolase n=1 Tax=unclassified Bacteroides TaxID=2646097 RepID=UPI000E801695|nr:MULTISPECIES: HDIG domain-containing metalloprotein [unclassified Bacteroides]RGN45149.1 HDIG domain-containing protein [Bacteroides sp. OM05-12]RHR73127.1 HDIG domain-containing protein [Bacteroides sp. AF16-49]